MSCEVGHTQTAQSLLCVELRQYGSPVSQKFLMPCQKQAVEADAMEREHGLGNLHPSARSQVTLLIMCLLGSAHCLGLYTVWSHMSHFSSKYS